MTDSKSRLAEEAMQLAFQWASRTFRNPDDRQDAAHEAWLLAQAGAGTPESIAWYAILRIKIQRQFRQSARSIDTPQHRGQKPKPCRVDLNQLIGFGDDPAAEAIAQIDFEAWRATHTKRWRRIIDLMVNGATTGELAQRYRVTPGRVSQWRRELADSLQGYLAEK